MPNFNIHWKIPFMSLRTGTLYTVNIWKDDALPSGYPLTLKGGAHPFVTQEDDNEDQFTPLRTQTGYLRIIDDGKAVNASNQSVAFSWKDLMPSTDTDRPVTLTHQSGGATVVDWQGYMQAQTFTGELYDGVQEREFPIQCPLSALTASNVDDANRALQNFAYVIKQAFDNLTCITIHNYIFQGGSYAQQWLLKLVDWQNLVSITENGVTGAYDNQRVIQDVCSFWGWTCRIYGQNVIFSCTDDTALDKALVLTSAQLTTMAGGLTAGATNTDFLSALTLTGDIFASRNNDDTLVRGYNKAVVNVDVNEEDKTLLSIFPDVVEKTMLNNGYYDGGNGNYYSNPLLSNSFYSPTLEGQNKANYSTFNLARYVDNVNSYTTADVIRIFKSSPSQASVSSADAYASLSTVFHHTLPGDYISQTLRPKGLVLKATAFCQGDKYDNNEGISGVGKKTMYIRLGIGTTGDIKWFSGLGWGSVKSTFEVTLGNKDPQLFYHNGVGYRKVIELPVGDNTLHGRIYVEFLGSKDMPEYSGERIFDIADFSIDYVDTDDQQSLMGEVAPDSSMEYVATNQGKASNEWDADLIYASQNSLALGYGLVINNSDFTFMEKAAYPSTTEHPEQRLATRVANYWASAKRKLATELRADAIPSISPRNKVTLDQTTAYPISISRDWLDDIVKLTLLEA